MIRIMFLRTAESELNGVSRIRPGGCAPGSAVKPNVNAKTNACQILVTTTP
jgi:hypothetical protein